MRRLLVVMIAAVSLVLMLGGSLLAAPSESPSAQANLFQLFLLDMQGDMQLLADQVYGIENRPPNWTRNEDLSSPLFTADLWFNNEQMADALYGIAVRPDGWIGATTANAELLARNVRHDLEIMADQTFGDSRTRPEGWTGARAVYRCSRTLQNVLRLLDTAYNVRPTTPDVVADFCAAVLGEIEDVLIRPILAEGSQSSDAQGLLSSLRGDLERLVDEKDGLNNRPLEWFGNRDAASATFVDDLISDIERFANNQLGFGIRPAGWGGFVADSQIATYNNLRFNLEVLADEVLGEGVRPNGWQGTNPVERCERDIQYLVLLVQQKITSVPLPENTSDNAVFCTEVAVAANNLAENPPAAEEIEPVANRLMAKSRYAFSYLDVAGLEYMGVMPYDTEFRVWYRNYNTSTMMFVTGDDFALFVDRRWTTMTEEAFRLLPTLDGKKPRTFCDASWCDGPRPTPTPTGDGPLVLLLSQSTPEPTRDTQNLQTQGKALVGWNNIRVSYLLDRPGGTVQVSLEICSDSTQTICEPVVSVFDNTTGTLRPVISQFNGLNVYEFKYGYQTNFVVEGATRFSNDIWISDCTFRSGCPVDTPSQPTQ